MDNRIVKVEVGRKGGRMLEGDKRKMILQSVLPRKRQVERIQRRGC